MPQVRQLQQEAAALLESLYSQRPQGGREVGHNGQSEGRGRARREGEDIPPQVADEPFEGETVPLGGAELESPADFPSLAGSASVAEESAVYLPPPPTASWVVTGSAGRQAGQHPAMRSNGGSGLNLADEFPTLGSESSFNTNSAVASPAAVRWGSRGSTHGQPSLLGTEVAVPTAPSVPGAAAFPSLGSASVPTSHRASGQWNSGISSAAAVVAAPPPSHATAPTFAVPAPPREFQSTVSDFPTLGAAAAPQRPPQRPAPQRRQAPPSGREELIQRNRLLMASLTQALQQRTGSADGMGEFKRVSGAFQRGELGPEGYLHAFIALFGEQASSERQAHSSNLSG